MKKIGKFLIGAFLLALISVVIPHHIPAPDNAVGVSDDEKPVDKQGERN